MLMNAPPGFLRANDPPMLGANPLVANRAQAATTLEVVVDLSRVAPENVPVVLAGCRSLGDAGRPAWES